MTEPHMTDMAIVRQMAEQIAESALLKFTQQHPEMKRMEIPPPLKWAGAIFAGLMTVGVAGLTFWVISTLNTLQLTVARMDERQQSQVSEATGRFQSIDDRLARLEEQQRRDADVAARGNSK